MADEEKRAYGCVFCTTGKEKAVAEEIEAMLPTVRAVCARQEKHKSENGKKSKVIVTILPSYVFFEAPADLQPSSCFPKDHVIRILTVENGVWQLAGSDEHFAKWLFKYNGLLDFSKAYKEGETIRIISGPLKDMEAQIRRIDKRGRSGQVALKFNGREVLAWLGFDLVDPLPKQVKNSGQ